MEPPFMLLRSFLHKRPRTAPLSLWMLIGLAAVGLFAPTSDQGEILQSRTAIVTLVLTLSMAIVAMRTRGFSHMQLLIGGFIIALLLSFSAFWADERTAWGALVPYLFFVTATTMQPGTRAKPGTLRGAWLVLSGAILVLGYGIVADSEIVRLFVLAYYSAFYDDLLRSMIGWSGKPVTVFGTHSLAAMFYFLFFSVHLALGVRFRKPLHFAVALAFVPLTYMLKSNSALLALALMTSTALAVVLIPTTRQRVVFALSGCLVMAAIALAYAAPLSADIAGILEKQTSGLVARFGEGGVLRENVSFLFKPLGLAELPGRVFYGDSGYVEYITRGSLPLLVLMYLGFYRFLKFNLRRAVLYVPFMTAVMLFEVGFTTLTYFRFVAVLPLVVVALGMCAGDRTRVVSTRQSPSSRPVNPGAALRTSS